MICPSGGECDNPGCRHGGCQGRRPGRGWRRGTIALALALALGAGGSAARPLFLKGGQPGPQGGGGGGGGGGPSQSCDGGSSVCAAFQNGQAFITWTDAASGAAGANFRYRVYRSTAPIDSGNYASATLIASYILNNSGQLFGGDPNNSGANSFLQSYRQNGSNPMAVLADLGTPLNPFTGLQVYTATGSGNAYYAVVSTDVNDGSPSYIGSVGPIGESVATPVAYKVADSLSRGQGYGKFTGASNLPVIMKMHQSGANSSCSSVSCQWGDYWDMWLTPAEGWQDGRQTAFGTAEDVAQHYPSLARSIEVKPRDTIWDSLGNLGFETYHIGIGMTPNPLVGAANRFYLTGRRMTERVAAFVLGKYSANANNVHWVGQSMGAWGGASTGIRMTSPTRLASMWLAYPVWRHDRRSTGNWPGKTWSSSMPFKATIAAAPSTLGTTASSVLMSDGSTWGGSGGYADTPTFIAANEGDDLPFTAWAIGKYDPYPVSFLEQIEALAAFKSAHRGHAFCWATMEHESTASPIYAIDLDGLVNGGGDAAVGYGKSLFRLDLPYIAFTSSSIDDNPGTNTPTANGLIDGDYLGCVNAGFKWTVTSDTSGAFNFTVSNAWMTRSPTTIPATTLSGSMASSGSGSVAVASTAGWLATGSNPYALVGGTEVVKITSTASNTITFSTRGMFGTAAQSHASGQTIQQLVTKPTGPNGGPYATMTADVTPRRMQGFVKPNGTTINCTVTPFGGSPAGKTGTVVGAHGVFTLTGITINSGGATSIACS
jgi:hypothetical protein